MDALQGTISSSTKPRAAVGDGRDRPQAGAATRCSPPFEAPKGQAGGCARGWLHGKLYLSCRRRGMTRSIENDTQWHRL